MSVDTVSQIAMPRWATGGWQRRPTSFLSVGPTLASRWQFLTVAHQWPTVGPPEIPPRWPTDVIMTVAQRWATGGPLSEIATGWPTLAQRTKSRWATGGSLRWPTGGDAVGPTLAHRGIAIWDIYCCQCYVGAYICNKYRLIINEVQLISEVQSFNLSLTFYLELNQLNYYIKVQG